MKRQLLLIIVLLGNFTLNAQSFYKTYTYGDYGFVAESQDTNLILLFKPFYPQSNNPYKFLELDFNGDSIGEEAYFDSNAVVKDFKRNITGGYTLIDNRFSWDYHIRNLDSELDTTTQFAVNDIFCNIREETIMLSDSSFICKGNYFSPLPQIDSGYVFRVDKTGIILWEMRFANWFVEFSVKDSLLFLLSNKFDSTIQTTKIDVQCLNVFSGIQNWQREFFDSTINLGIRNSLTANDITVSDSGIFLASRLKTSATGLYTPFQLIIALDNNGDSVWSEVVNQGRFSYLISNDANELIWIGNNSDSSEIRKYDYQGDLIWRNSLLYGNFDALMSFIETSDGGYAFTSDHRDSIAHFLVAKTDNLGRLNITNEVNYNFSQNLRFRYSPTTQTCIINLEGNDLYDLVGSVYSIEGRKVFEERIRSTESILNVSGLESGIYILSIMNSKGFKRAFKFAKLN
ncbi:MAG TPA: T9SS type A sorting domain-containing protein [Bacteroidia bacterium]|nr:T9SS type A sorting domain-containing protein [Bacteroidia bacterium]